MKLSIPAFALLLAFTAVGCDSGSAGPSTTAAAVISREADLTTFRGASYASGALGTMNDYTQEYTVLAATNEAFTASASDVNVSVSDILGRPDMKQITFVHVIRGASLRAADLTNGQELTTVAGKTLTVVLEGDRVGFDVNGDAQADAFVSAADIEASNGVIHKVDRVFLSAGQ